MTQVMMSAREIAFDAYVRVMDQGQSPEDATEALYRQLPEPLKRVDRNFVKELLFGSLRWHAKILWILQHTAKRDLAASTPEIRASLVLGTYQIFYMDKVPDRAAVNESVEYIRKKGQANAVSFVNGILRQIARRAEYFTKPDKKAKPIDYLALQFSHPHWIVRRWFQLFSFERMEKMLAANNQPPPWSVRINQLKTPLPQVNELQARLLKDERGHTERRPLRSSLQFKAAPNMDAESLFAQGYYTIQDEASQLIGLLVAPGAGQSILEGAAGPGGKLGHVYELGEGKITLTAVEKNPVQMQKAKDTIQRLGHEGIHWVESDLLDFKPEQKFDKVLLDAPCSGLGVLRRHPEGKWQKREALIRTMSELQRKLIEHVILNLLKPGGELIYSVCSFEPEETESHVAWIRENYSDRIELLSPVPRLPDYYKRYVTRQNLLLVYAGNQDEMDGFGAFILKAK